MKEIRLASMDLEQSCSMMLESTLLELGNRCKAILPTLLRHKNGSKIVNLKPLPPRYTRLVHGIPPDPAIQPGTLGLSRGEARMARFGNKEQKDMKEVLKVDTENYLHSEPCTNDPNCTLLAQLLVPDIIISASPPAPSPPSSSSSAPAPSPSSLAASRFKSSWYSVVSYVPRCKNTRVNRLVLNLARHCVAGR